MDGQGLNLEYTGLTFSIFFYAIGCKNYQELIMVSAPSLVKFNWSSVENWCLLFYRQMNESFRKGVVSKNNSARVQHTSKRLRKL